MAASLGPDLIEDGLILSLDAGDINSVMGSTVEVLVVAGGGGGGKDMGGGGGGGGVVYNSSYAVTQGTAVTVTVGNGGYGAPAGSTYRGDGAGPQPSAHQFTISATQGGNSVFGSITSTGGGFGASSYYGYTPNSGTGGSGGSGGGCSGYTHGGERYVNGSNGSAANNVSGQGYPGGNSGDPTTGANDHYSGGGGGAGGAGTSGPGHVGPNGTRGNGGPGALYSTMSPYYFAGGGGGAGHTGDGGHGGVGGGGGGAGGSIGLAGTGGINIGSNGSSGSNAPGGDAGVNTGGGGGGGTHYNSNNKGGNGGSGIVIVRYSGPQKATGGTITTVAGYTIHTFTSSGTFTPNLIWYDSSGNGNNFTIQGNITWNAVNGFSNFDGNSTGSGNKIFRNSFPQNLKTSQGGNGYTIIIVAKSTVSGGWRKLIGNSDGENYIELYQNATGNTWHQDGSGETLYVDGVQVGQDTFVMYNSGYHFYAATNLNNGLTTNPTYALTIGNEPNSSPSGTNSYPWVGNIVIVLMYNRVLTNTELLRNYNVLKSRFGL